MTPETRRALTVITQNANARRFVEYAVVPRILLWVCHAAMNASEDEATPETREVARERYRWLETLLVTMAIPLGRRAGDEALAACKTVIDDQFIRYTRDRERKRTSWLTISAYHLGARLLDDGLIPPYEVGSPMAQVIDSVLTLVTPEQIEMFDRGARKAADLALANMRAKPYGLWQKPWEEYQQTRQTTHMLDAFKTQVEIKNG